MSQMREMRHRGLVTRPRPHSLEPRKPWLDPGHVASRPVCGAASPASSHGLQGQAETNPTRPHLHGQGRALPTRLLMHRPSGRKAGSGACDPVWALQLSHTPRYGHSLTVQLTGNNHLTSLSLLKNMQGLFSLLGVGVLGRENTF